ncbi:MAG: hypothetical protein WD830_05700 [Chloroflexota bacterium]
MKEEPLSAEESLELLRENASRLAAVTDSAATIDLRPEDALLVPSPTPSPL